VTAKSPEVNTTAATTKLISTTPITVLPDQSGAGYGGEWGPLAAAEPASTASLEVAAASMTTPFDGALMTEGERWLLTLE
jgi:hypothetical protein